MVGGAVVELTMDLAKFGSQAKTDIAKALGGSDLKQAINKGLDDAGSDAGKSGEKTGKAATEGMATGVKSGGGSVKDAATKVSEDAGKSAESTFGRYGSSAASAFSNAAKIALVGGGLAIAGGLAAVFKTGIDEQSDFLKGQAQLAAGLKSTGGAAGTTTDHLEDLASSIQNYSGQTDDSIVASEQLLLTFTNIKDTAGQGNDVLDQTVKISADMAARMGGDASSSAIQLGKALNDPVNGITALSRVGVSFTDAQKKQIAAMQASGDVMGAQKVILKELNTEFGGSAKAAGETLPGQMARAKRSFEDVSQSLVAAAMPALVKLGDILTKYVVPAFQVAVNWIIANWPRIQRVIVSVFENYVMPVVMAVVGFFRKYVIPAVAAVVEYIIGHWPEIERTFVLFWQTVKPVLEAYKNYLLTLWHTIIEPLIAWVKAHWSEISEGLKIAAIVIGIAFKAIAVFIETYITIITEIIRIAVPIIVGIIQTIVDIVEIVIAIIKFFYNDIWSPTWALVAAAIDGAKTLIVASIGGINDAINAIGGFFETAYNDVKGWIDNVVGVVTGLPGRILGIAGDMLNAGTSLATSFFNGLSSLVDKVGSGIVSGITSALNNVVIGPIDSAIGFINSKLIDTANNIPFVNISHIPQIPRLAKGGWIGGSGGPTADNQLILASPKEFMVKASAAARNRRVLESINSGATVTDISSRASGTGGGTDPELVAAIMALASRPVSVQVDKREIARASNNGNLVLNRAS